MGTRIIGRPLMTIEEFINENRSPLSLRTELVWGSIRPTLRHPLSLPGSFDKNFDPFNPGTTNVPGEGLYCSVVDEKQFKSMKRISAESFRLAAILNRCRP